MGESSNIEVQRASWSVLREHLRRDAVIVVSEELDLSYVAQRVVEDETAEVIPWLEQSLLSKPNQEQTTLWDGTPEREFCFVIAQPFVLIQLAAN